MNEWCRAKESPNKDKTDQDETRQGETHTQPQPQTQPRTRRKREWIINQIESKAGAKSKAGQGRAKR